VTCLHRRLVGFIVLVVIGTLGFAGTASAHAILDSSSPASSTVVAQAPGEIALDFSEPVEERFASVRLFEAGESDREIDIDAPRRLSTDSSTVVASIPPIPDGLYVVVWRVTSSDGHPVSGAFPFEVGNTSSGRSSEALDRIISSLRGGSNLAVPLGIARLLSYLGTVLLIGLTVLHWRGGGLGRVSTVRAMTLGAVGFVTGAIAMLLLQGAHSAGAGWSGVLDGALVADAAGTRVGLAMVARFALGVLWIAVIMGAARGLGHGAPWQNAAFLVAVSTTVTFPLAGHLSAVAWPVLHVALGAVHVGAVSIWIGGLIGAVIARRDDPSIVARLSLLATRAMPVAVVTGLVNAARLTEGPGGMFTGEYGRALAAKTSLVVVMVGVALIVRRRMRSDARTGPVLRVEVLAALLILAATATMTGTSPVGAGAPIAFNATLSQNGVIADVAVSPAAVGTAEVHVIFTPPGGALAPVDKVEMRMELPSRDIPVIPVDVVPAGPNHFVGIVQIPYAGSWAIEVRGTNAGAVLRWSTTMEID